MGEGDSFLNVIVSGGLLGRTVSEQSEARGRPLGLLCKSVVCEVLAGKPPVLYLAPAVCHGLGAGSTWAQRGVRL